MIHISANYSNGHSSDTGPPQKNKKHCFSLHIVTHLCQFMAHNSEIWGGVKKNRQLFDISKIATLRPSKWLIGHIFKNPHQGM